MGERNPRRHRSARARRPPLGDDRAADVVHEILVAGGAWTTWGPRRADRRRAPHDPDEHFAAPLGAPTTRRRLAPGHPRAAWHGPAERHAGDVLSAAYWYRYYASDDDRAAVRRPTRIRRGSPTCSSRGTSTARAAPTTRRRTRTPRHRPVAAGGARTRALRAGSATERAEQCRRERLVPGTETLRLRRDERRGSALAPGTVGRRHSSGQPGRRSGNVPGGINRFARGSGVVALAFTSMSK